MYKVKQSEVKDLEDKIAELEASTSPTIVNDLTTGGTTSALSAEQGKVLKVDVDAKLTATQATTQADSVASDVAGLVTDFNSLLAKLKSAGLMA